MLYLQKKAKKIIVGYKESILLHHKNEIENILVKIMY